MTLQWLREREFNGGQSFDCPSFDSEDGIRRLLDACPSVLTDKAFNEAVEQIARDGEDLSRLDCSMVDVSTGLELSDVPESGNLLMALACAEALAVAPSLSTWERVRKLKSNSWQLENWLFGIMKVGAERNADRRAVYVGLAKAVFEALDGLALVSQFERYNHERKQFREDWNESTNRLEKIWWGLRGYECSDYEESPLFRLIAALAPTEFIYIVSQSRNPHLVNAALWAGGAFEAFSVWEKCAVSAPAAFADDGSWNGSVTIPLLLVMARDELMQAGYRSTRPGMSEVETEDAKQEITNLVTAVVGALAKREDALPLFARWSTWLMRQQLMQNRKVANNVRSSVVVDESLIEAIGRALKGKRLVPESPADASAWEAWCYRAVLASHAHSGFIAVPDCEGFLGEWDIGFDDWSDTRGKQLRERASLIVTMNSGIPGNAAHSLAYPIAMSGSPVDQWGNLWETTLPLREIVEFDDNYQERGEAGKLLLLVFCMGLAILDQRVALCPTADSPQARDLARLHEALALAVREMREIDDTLNREQWQQAAQHLAVRRVIWEEIASDEGAGRSFAVFLLTDQPTFSDYLIDARNDVMELVAMLQMARLNGAASKRIGESLAAASIDLSATVATARRLNGISDRQYPINEEQLKEVLSGI
jgi:hypothetical protein